MSDRTPATDKGTADRIEADDGGYWVRLVTKQALRREGECMGNCLDSMGYGREFAGDEEMVSDGLWSLRQANGVSYLLVEIDVSCDRDTASVTEAEGPKNSDPLGWSCRQLRHLVAGFAAAGCKLRVRDRFALTDEDGMTWRPDKAPEPLRMVYEERQRREREERERLHQERQAQWAERGDRLLGGEDSPFIILSRDTQEVQRALRPRSEMGWFQWSTDPVSDFISVDRSGAVEFRGCVEPGVERGVVLELREPGVDAGTGPDTGASPVTPEPTLRERLMTRVIRGVLTPGPLPREPPASPPVPMVSARMELEALNVAVRAGLVSRETVTMTVTPRRAADGFFRTRIGEYGDGYMASPARAYLVLEAPGGFVQHRAVPPVRLP